MSVHPKSFIRPSPSAGSLGGVARKTRETIILCEAAGFDKIFVETVGVGQSETAVHSMVDFFLLIQLAGTGDELQGIKRGIMEMADGIIINKADGNNVEKAQLAATHFRNALHLFPAPESGWTPQVLTYSGFYNIGVKEIWDMVYAYITSSARTVILNTVGMSRPNTGCMKPSMSICATASIRIRKLLPCFPCRKKMCWKDGQRLSRQPENYWKCISPG